MVSLAASYTQVGSHLLEHEFDCTVSLFWFFPLLRINRCVAENGNILRSHVVTWQQVTGMSKIVVGIRRFIHKVISAADNTNEFAHSNLFMCCNNANRGCFHGLLHTKNPDRFATGVLLRKWFRVESVRPTPGYLPGHLQSCSSVSPDLKDTLRSQEVWQTTNKYSLVSFYDF